MRIANLLTFVVLFGTTACNCFWRGTGCGVDEVLSPARPPAPDLPQPSRSAPTSRLPSGTTGAELAHSILHPAQATYEIADTTLVEIESGTGTIQLQTGTRVEAQLELTPAADGLRATIGLASLKGSGTTLTGASFDVSAENLPAPAQVAVTRRGETTVLFTPAVSAEAQRVIRPIEIYTRLFMRLPGHGVQRGATWTDTISVFSEGSGLKSETVRIVTSVWTRDTTIAGWVMNVIMSTSSITVRTRGIIDGVEIHQDLAGQATATTLWHAARRRMLDQRESISAHGRTDLPTLELRGATTSLSARYVLRLKN